MRGFKLVILIAVCLGVTTVQADMIINGGFETGSLTPWYQGGGSGVENWNVTSADAHSGLYSATDVGNIEIRQNFVAIPVNQIVELSYWLKQPEAALSAFHLYYSDSSYYEGAFNLSTTDWEFFDVTSSLEAGKDLIGFSVYGYVGSNEIEDRTYLDDVTLSVVPVPGAVLLGWIGLSCSAGLLRRRKAL
jgi:hypothetical protein